MKLGSQTGSVVNHLYSRMVKNAPLPKIGEGATILGWTDRHAGTVIEVFSKGKSVYVKVQSDIAKRIDSNGMSENQDYEYTPNPQGIVYVFKRKSDGRWAEVSWNEQTKRFNEYDGGKGLRVGVRDKYYDYSF